MTTHSKSLYQPLTDRNAVRFIRLLPDLPPGKISLEIVYERNITKASPQTYEATSYTWGSPRPSHEILVDGQEFNLRENAYFFLLQLRQEHESRLLWMDCVCINQEDTDERAQQVEIMHLIYQRARKVLIWLGKEDDKSAIAMQYIAEVETAAPQKEMELSLYGNTAVYKSKSFLFDNMIENEESKRIISALTALLSRQWFRRVWVQQEAALCSNSTVICGSAEVSWEQLISLIWLLKPRVSRGWPDWTGSSYQEVEIYLDAARRIHWNRMSYRYVQNPVHSESAYLNYYNKLVADPNLSEIERVTLNMDPTGLRPIGQRLSQLIRDCSGCEATDPRDKMYSLYNIHKETGHSCHWDKRPKVTYKFPWQIIFVRIAKWMYEDWRPTDPLELAGRCQQDGAKSIPSWAPDPRTEIQVLFVFHSAWAAGGLAYQPHLRFLSLPRSSNLNGLPAYSYVNYEGKTKRIPNEGLELTAILQDQIIYSSPKLSFDADRGHNSTRIKLARVPLEIDVSQVLHKLQSDIKYIETNVPLYFTGESGLEALAGTIIANTTEEDELATAEYERCGLSQWQTWLENNIPDPPPSYHDAVENNEYLTKNNLYITAHGLMCLVPTMAAIGDYVAILQGFRFPVALRRVGEPLNQWYELIGSCYIHRMMRGRAWNLIEEFKCKYRPGSEDEVGGEFGESLEGVCGSFPFNAKDDYCRVIRALGKRRIVLV